MAKASRRRAGVNRFLKESEGVARLVQKGEVTAYVKDTPSGNETVVIRKTGSSAKGRAYLYLNNLYMNIVRHKKKGKLSDVIALSKAYLEALNKGVLTDTHKINTNEGVKTGTQVKTDAENILRSILGSNTNEAIINSAEKHKLNRAEIENILNEARSKLGIS